MGLSTTLDKLILIDSTGVNVASFVDIKSALIDRYKEIYGSDIDLSTGNADGEYVNELALMINNMLQVIKSLYGNLDVNTASGVYLEALCNLSNVHRKRATHSIANVQLTNNSAVTIQMDAVALTLQDKSGLIWNYAGISQMTLSIAPGASLVIPVKCSEFGPVKAPAGWIDTVIGEANLSVIQSEAASIGTNEETDTELRSRRNRFVSPIGSTVLGALYASLFEIGGIKDVKIYNNPKDSTQAQSTDGTLTLPHSIYVIIRQIAGTTDITDVIADTIYQKLTPGIRTTPSSVNDAAKSKTIISSSTIFTETIYWKQAIPINPTIVLKYTEVQGTGYSPQTSKVMANSIIDYINNLSIGNTVDANEILVEMLSSDLREKGLATIQVSYSDIVNGLSNVTTNPDTYYEYSGYDESVEGLVHTITLK